MAMKVKKGDRVKVLSGKDRGKEGEVMRSIPSRGKVIVEGVNMVKKNQRQTRATMQGGIIDKDRGGGGGGVAVVCSTCGATRVGFRFDDQGHKIRVCKKCGTDL